MKSASSATAAGLSEKTQRKVLDELTQCFDDVSVEDAAQMKF